MNTDDLETNTNESEIQTDDIKVQTYLQKSRLLGFNIEMQGHHNSYIYIVHKSDTEHTVLIPKQINDVWAGMIGRELKGHIKVIGGSGLKQAPNMFMGCKAETVDVSDFDTSNMKEMDALFSRCSAQLIGLNCIDTSNATTMNAMFDQYGGPEVTLDLSNFNTKNVEDMNAMFNRCKVKALDLSSFNTENVTDMGHMFSSCVVEDITLYTFNTSKVKNMSNMFCTFQNRSWELDLRSFDTSNVKSMNSMFNRCDVPSIDLTSFTTNSIVDIKYIFTGYKGVARATDPRILGLIKNRNRVNF